MHRSRMTYAVHGREQADWRQTAGRQAYRLWRKSKGLSVCRKQAALLDDRQAAKGSDKAIAS